MRQIGKIITHENGNGFQAIKIFRFLIPLWDFLVWDEIIVR